MSVSKNTLKKVDHHAFLRDTRGQIYPIYACTDTYHAHHFTSSQYILLQLEARDFKLTLEKS